MEKSKYTKKKSLSFAFVQTNITSITVFSLIGYSTKQGRQQQLEEIEQIDNKNGEISSKSKDSEKKKDIKLTL